MYVLSVEKLIPWGNLDAQSAGHQYKKVTKYAVTVDWVWKLNVLIAAKPHFLVITANTVMLD